MAQVYFEPVACADDIVSGADEPYFVAPEQDDTANRQYYYIEKCPAEADCTCNLIAKDTHWRRMWNCRSYTSPQLCIHYLINHLMASGRHAMAKEAAVEMANQVEVLEDTETHQERSQYAPSKAPAESDGGADQMAAPAQLPVTLQLRSRPRSPSPRSPSRHHARPRSRSRPRSPSRHHARPRSEHSASSKALGLRPRPPKTPPRGRISTLDISRIAATVAETMQQTTMQQQQQQGAMQQQQGASSSSSSAAANVVAIPADSEKNIMINSKQVEYLKETIQRAYMACVNGAAACEHLRNTFEREKAVLDSANAFLDIMRK